MWVGRFTHLGVWVGRLYPPGRFLPAVFRCGLGVCVTTEAQCERGSKKPTVFRRGFGDRFPTKVRCERGSLKPTVFRGGPSVIVGAV